MNIKEADNWKRLQLSGENEPSNLGTNKHQFHFQASSSTCWQTQSSSISFSVVFTDLAWKHKYCPLVFFKVFGLSMMNSLSSSWSIVTHHNHLAIISDCLAKLVAGNVDLTFERLSEEDKLGNLGKKSHILKSNFVELLCICKKALKVIKELLYLCLSMTWNRYRLRWKNPRQL